MEEIAHGHRIRKYFVETRVAGQWQQVSQGAAVGHKKIDRFAVVQCDALRLIVQESAATPRVRDFQAFCVS
jgi:alpha-L-fucosidase